MSDQETILSRIGSWFKKGSRGNGEFAEQETDRGRHGRSSAADDHGLMSPHETRSSFLRPWARRDAAIDNMQNGLQALGELMTGIKDNLQRSAQRQDELLQYLSHLPQALQQLPENSRLQTETLKAIHQRMERQSEEQSKLAEILERISQADNMHGRTLEALQDRVESLNEHDKAMAENLSSVGSAMHSVSKTSETSALVLQQMRDNVNQRDGEMERILHRQGNRFTTMLAVAIFLSIAALVAVAIIGYLGYEMLQATR